MKFFVCFQRILLFFLILAIVLPVASIFLFLWGTVMKSFGDQAGATLLYAVTTGGIIAWLVSLIVILLLLALDRLATWSE